MKYIKWDVKEVRIDKEQGRRGEVTATLKGSAPFGIGDDPVRIHKDLYNYLNLTVDSLYPNSLPLTEADKVFLNSLHGDRKPAIKKVVFNDPATIVFWQDGTKTVVKSQNGEKFDPEKGLAMAITKKTFGNEGNYYNSIKKWVDEYCDSKTFGDSLMEAEEDRRACAKYAGLRAAYYILYQVSHNKKSTKSEFSETMEEAMAYIKDFLDKED